MKDIYQSFFYFFLLLTLFLFQPFIAYAGPGNSYNKIVFFGDSLTDNGNLYNYDFGYLPKSPPYFQGRFTNGYVWADKVAKYFYDEYLMASNNYALGGQTAIFHGPSNKYLPVSLSMAINTYLWRSSWVERTKTLYLMWIGGNDYLRGVYNVDDATDAVISSIKYNIENLIYYGGMNFIIVNLPDLSKTPSGLKSENSEELGILTALHNAKLKQAISEIELTYKTINIKMFDAHFLFDELLKNSGSDTIPDAHITNKTEGCWMGGYTFKANLQNKSSVHDHLNRYIGAHSKEFNGTKGKDFDVTQFETAILDSPDLIEALNVIQSAEDGTQIPCKNPDEYLFWDQLHPTAIVHRMFAKRMIDFISTYFSAERTSHPFPNRMTG